MDVLRTAEIGVYPISTIIVQWMNLEFGKQRTGSGAGAQFFMFALHYAMIGPQTTFLWLLR